MPVARRFIAGIRRRHMIFVTYVTEGKGKSIRGMNPPATSILSRWDVSECDKIESGVGKEDNCYLTACKFGGLFMKAKDFDKNFDAGKDVTKQLDLPNARRHKQDQKRVTKEIKKPDPSLIDDENPDGPRKV